MELRFGGQERSDGCADGTLGPLELLPARKFVTAFHRWLYACHAYDPDAPREPAQIRAFDPWPLLPRFRADYAKGLVYASEGGTSIQDTVLGGQLMLRQSVYCLLAERFADQPTSRLRHVTILGSGELAAVCAGNLRRLHARVTAMTWLGDFGHSITLIDGDPQAGWIEFFENRPDRSLIPGAVGGPAPDTWRIGIDRFAEIVVAVTVPEFCHRFWSDHPDTEAPAAKINPADSWDGPKPSQKESTLNRMRTASSHQPQSRLYEALVATMLVHITASAQLPDEAVGWLRSAALMGHRAAAGRLSTARQAQGDEQEYTYWASLAAFGDQLFEPVLDDIDAAAILGGGAGEDQPSHFGEDGRWTTYGTYQEAAGLSEVAQTDSAVALFDAVIAEGHPRGAPLGALAAGHRLESVNPVRAAAYFRQATLTTYLPVLVEAALGYGSARARVGRTDGLRAGLERAAFSGLPGAGAARSRLSSLGPGRPAS